MKTWVISRGLFLPRGWSREPPCRRRGRCAGGARAVLTLILYFLLAQILYDAVLAAFSRIAQDGVAGRDFSCFYAAARVARAGGDFYDRQQLQHHAEQAGYRHPLFPYLYPPFFLALVMPWAGLSYRAAFTVWVVMLSLPIEPYFGLIHVWEGPDALMLPLRTLAYHLKTFGALTLWGMCLITARRLCEKRSPACCQTDLL